MMLFEHRDKLNEKARTRHRRIRPMLDEQELDDIIKAIGMSMFMSLPITLVFWREFDDREHSGIITRVNKENRALKMTTLGGEEWIKFDDVVKVI